MAAADQNKILIKSFLEMTTKVFFQYTNSAATETKQGRYFY
jgi:hypothetical protein